MPTCTEPYAVLLNKQSLSGAAATNYCGIDEDLTTCEAVLALVNNWRCPSDIDGMCGPLGDPEVAVLGTVCEEVGGLGLRCTYACDGVQQCPLAVTSCGDGDMSPPGWCGG